MAFQQSEDFFRSAEMSLVQLYISSEIARDVVSKLGEMSIIQFRDLNKDVNSFQRSFVKEIRRLDEVERQLNSLHSITSKHGIEPSWLHPDDLSSQSAPKQQAISDLITRVASLESRITQLDSAYDSLQEKQSALLELRHVISAARDFFRQPTRRNSIDARPSGDFSGATPLLAEESEAQEAQEAQLAHLEDGLGNSVTSNANLLSVQSFVTGVVDTDKTEIMQKLLWRALRGNLYLEFFPISEPLFDSKAGNSGKGKYKSVFLVFTHGQLLFQKVRRIVEALDGKIYKVDNDLALMEEANTAVNSRISDMAVVADSTRAALSTELQLIAPLLASWKATIRKEKAVYAVLNLCDQDAARKALIAEGWTPKSDVPQLQSVLREASVSAGGRIPSVLHVLETSRTPPTFHRCNKLTAAFQNIVDAYGVATYREVNPALAAVITFPFLFAVMFGDVGHGFLVLLAAAVLVVKEEAIGKMKRDEIFDMAFSGRYVLLLMGVFSIYTGLLYNDVFSRSFSLFRTGWRWPSHWEKGEPIVAQQVGVYPIGIDPTWHGAENNLIFSNSYKMKLSVLLGFAHMLYSLMFSAVNYRYFRSRVDMIGNFIPGLLFMVSIFGYLVFAIVYKWCINWSETARAPPGLLNMLIGMFLSPGTVAEPLYSGQQGVQLVLLAVAAVCVPWLLLYKPVALYYATRHSRAGYLGLREMGNVAEVAEVGNVAEVADTSDLELPVAQPESSYSAAASASDADPDPDSHSDEHEMGDVVIHQVIHTIEFCLNCVSHTASYLRLWALSLAHAQLSSVLWSMTLGASFGMTGGFGVFMTVVLFGMWFVLTVCILVLMEGTSAMLHSLRLHWVEAMSKFFEGEGYAYEPFSFAGVLKEE